MTPQQIDAMKLALEALQADELDMVDDGSGNMVFRKEQAITAIEEVLAEHAMQEVQRLGQEIEQCQCPECQIKPHASDCAVHSEPAYPKGKCDCGAQPEQEPKIGCVNHDCDQCKAQPEQEPVAWMDKYGEIYKDVPKVLSTDKPLYTSPPQRPWVGLTEEERDHIWNKSSGDVLIAMEAKLKEKNT